MRKAFLIALLCILVVSVACSSTSETESKPGAEHAQKNKQHDDVVNNDQKSNEKEKDQEKIEVDDVDEEIDAKPEPEYVVNENWFIKPIQEHSNEEVVLLTIDDAPDGYALEMAKTLQTLEANAIFFVNGHFLETPDEKAILKEIHEMGFLIGNHTYSHAHLPDLSEEEQKEEIIQVNDMVEDVIGERPKFFRAPHGKNTDYSREIAKEEGMTLMNWSYGYDWEKQYMSQEAITDIMIHTELLGNGANLLMHDREWTAAALHDIVVGLREKGYEMVDPSLIQTKE